jgi:hypothetical protein
VPVVFTNESKDVDQLLSQIRLPARFIPQVKREHATALKLKRNWWDLVPLYCDETLSNEAALDSVLDTTGITKEVADDSMEPRVF